MSEDHDRRLAELNAEIESIYRDMEVNCHKMSVLLRRPPWWRPFKRRRFDRMMSMMDRGPFKLARPTQMDEGKR